MLHAVQSALDVLHRPQREEHPSAHQARPHGRKRAVEHGEQRSAVAVVGRDEFEIANRELVESHIALFLNAGDAGDVLNVVVLRLLEISENRPRRRGGCVEMIDAEAFEVLHVEVLEHLGARRSFGESPIVEFEDEITSRKELFEFSLLAAFDEHLLRRKARQQFVDIFGVAFRHEILARRDVEQREPHVGRAEVQGGKEVVFAAR